ncbi:MAG: hypothetical protein JXR37_31720 [Kiritimatiellae bacterium]|nr:hypothetical protein [Kiritimatiellia bacterium]
MAEMTGIERIHNTLKRKPIDRIGVHESFWGDTRRVWQQGGHIGEHEDLADHFGLDISTSWCFNMTALLDFEKEVLEETDETILTRDGNLAVLRHHKLHASPPENVDYAVKDRKTWEDLLKPHLTPSRARINFEQYRNAKARAAVRNRFFCWAGAGIFERIHPVCGHENMLIGMALDPEWVKDMGHTFAELYIALMEILFAEEGKPDAVWFYDDMGYKQHPFMSPQMYKELIQPYHTRTVEWAHAQGLPVLLHCCGFVEPLLPGIVEAGFDCLQAIEIKAGMDLLRIKKNFGDRLVLFGGMDARYIANNDRAGIRRELAEKIPFVKQDYGYILQSDHSIPSTTQYETYKFFVEEGLRLGTY